MPKLQLRKARIRFEGPRFPLESLPAVLRGGMRGLPPLEPGARVAVAVGSRGIANLARIVRDTVASLRAFGTQPFIVPAMGSHGGATADGQRAVLASYGITEGEIGCAIHSSMDVVELDARGLEHRLFLDAQAAGADAIVMVNRIKPHTSFHGRIESGLAKMAVIGLGKDRQAAIMHGFGVRGLRDLMPLAAARVLAASRIWCGVAVVENARDETALVEVVPAGRILAREPELLELARANMPRLPIDALDVLLVDEMGKNISGTGLDTNIVGRLEIAGQPEPESPRIGAIAVMGLTAETRGNALGVGLADVITERLLGQIDRAATFTNVVTSGFIERGKIPLAAPTDAEAFAVALRSCGRIEPGRERVLRIRNTLHLDEVLASPAVAAEIDGRPGIEWRGGFEEAFDEAGRLAPWDPRPGGPSRLE